MPAEDDEAAFAQAFGQLDFHPHRMLVAHRIQVFVDVGTRRSPQRFATPAALTPALWFASRASGASPVVPT